MYAKSENYPSQRPLSRAELQRLLPKLGDHRMERPTIDETTPSRGSIQYTTPQRCVVVEVNEAHLWYTVQFENGIRESYKVPKTRPGDLGGGS